MSTAETSEHSKFVHKGYFVVASVIGIVCGTLLLLFGYQYIIKKRRLRYNGYRFNRSSSIDDFEKEKPRSSFCSLVMSDILQSHSNSSTTSPSRPQRCTLPTAPVALNIARVQPNPERRQTLPAISLTPPMGGTENIEPDGYEDESLLTHNKSRLNPMLGDFLETAKRRFSGQMTLSFDSPNSEFDNRRRSSSICSERFSIIDNRSTNSSFSRLDGNMDGNDNMSILALNLYGYGRLCFSLSYNKEHGVLYVTVHKAAHLLGNQNPRETNRFFVKITLTSFLGIKAENGEEVKKQRYFTSVVSATHNPMFEQTLSMSLSWDRVEDSEVKFAIKQAFNDERCRTLGTASFKLMQSYLKNSENGSLQDVWRDLKKNSDPLLPLTTAQSSIFVSLNFELNRQSLLVGILKGQNFRVDENDSSVYVRLSLMAAERILTTRKTQAIKDNLTEPQFNEEFTLPIDSSLLNSVCIVLFICSRNLDRYSHRIGNCVIGPVTYTDGTGLSHWNQMCNEHNDSKMWHTV